MAIPGQEEQVWFTFCPAAQYRYVFSMHFLFTVHGDANFSMEHTSLTIGGFTQPSVARNLIEMPTNAEKGLSQRFLWFFPKPCYNKFNDLEPVDEEFSDDVGEFKLGSTFCEPSLALSAAVLFCL